MMKWQFVGDGYNIPITNMFDIDGEETDDPAMACTIVGPLPDGKWLACQCSPHDIVPMKAVA